MKHLSRHHRSGGSVFIACLLGFNIPGYSATVTRSGAGATGLNLSNLPDSHTSLVPGKLSSTPVAFDRSVTTNEDTSVSITIQGQDPDNSNLTFTNISRPQVDRSEGSPLLPVTDQESVRFRQRSRPSPTFYRFRRDRIGLHHCRRDKRRKYHCE